MPIGPDRGKIMVNIRLAPAGRKIQLASIIGEISEESAKLMKLNTVNAHALKKTSYANERRWALDTIVISSCLPCRGVINHKEYDYAIT